MKVGLLVSRSGAAGLWAPSAEACTLLAAAELNASGGIDGRPVELVVRDMGTDRTTANDAAAILADEDMVDVVMGMHPSILRNAVGRQLGGRIPYLFTPHYEGGESRPGVCSIGETTSDLLLASVSWLTAERRATRFFLASTDCVWPRGAIAHARRIVPALGAVIVDDVTVPADGLEYGELLDQIRQAAPDVVLVCMTGMDSVRFNRQFAEAGLQHLHLRLALGFDETALYALGDAASENLYVASGYFSSVRSRANGTFLERYHTAFDGVAPPPNGYGQSCYEGLHFLAALARRESGLRKLGPHSARGVAYRTARGSEPVSTSRHGTLHLAMADGIDFRLVAKFDPR
jgi:urea transport system substrate-binding protein